MDFFEFDRRIRRIEAQFKRVERFLRSDALRWWRRGAVAAVVLGIAVLGARGLDHYLLMRQARIDRVDDALASDYPSYESGYCRWLFGNKAPYEDCLREEQINFSRFEAAWRGGERLGDLREQMITCFSGAQNEGGISWKSAADCAELNGVPTTPAEKRSERRAETRKPG